MWQQESRLDFGSFWQQLRRYDGTGGLSDVFVSKIFRNVDCLVELQMKFPSNHWSFRKNLQPPSGCQLSIKLDIDHWSTFQFGRIGNSTDPSNCPAVAQFKWVFYKIIDIYYQVLPPTAGQGDTAGPRGEHLPERSPGRDQVHWRRRRGRRPRHRRPGGLAGLWGRVHVGHLRVSNWLHKGECRTGVVTGEWECGPRLALITL